MTANEFTNTKLKNIQSKLLSPEFATFLDNQI